MKKPFYEVLWHMARKEGFISKLLEEGYLINTQNTYAWTPKAQDLIGLESVVGVFVSDEDASEEDVEYTGSTLEESLVGKKTTRKRKPVEEKEIIWLEEFMAKFSVKNIGVSGKSSNKRAVLKKMNQFLSDYDYTKEEILEATDSYIVNLKGTNSMKFIQESHYFISKLIEGVPTSNLAKWCEEVRNNGGSSKRYTSHTIL